MSEVIVARTKLASKEYWQHRAISFLADRMGKAGAQGWEFVAGYIDDFIPVYALPKRVEENWWYAWMITPGVGKVARIVTALFTNTYLDHQGNVWEHDEEWVLVIGTISRIGKQPLLTKDMLKGLGQ